MAKDLHTNVTLEQVKPSAIDPATGRTVTQYAILRLPSGRLVRAFEGAHEHAFSREDVGVSFSLLLYLVAGDRSIEHLDLPHQSFSQEDHTATIEGLVVSVTRETEETIRVFVDAGECHVFFVTGVELKEGHYVRAAGRLEVADKRRL